MMATRHIPKPGIACPKAASQSGANGRGRGDKPKAYRILPYVRCEMKAPRTPQASQGTHALGWTRNVLAPHLLGKACENRLVRAQDRSFGYDISARRYGFGQSARFAHDQAAGSQVPGV